ncbi:hypothetical protein FA13DRAFT_1724065 [Coprinellus micaceus]|uniref:Uncharacterized protein n=1 Tax=Coprinellus micaceus TaxID=71717 RepID=A0A4Y7U0A2_COPMI|nr:hypothetical protein FA13DRAFT_1724065 [Coprinellus micaceus]
MTVFEHPSTLLQSGNYPRFQVLEDQRPLHSTPASCLRYPSHTGYPTVDTPSTIASVGVRSIHHGHSICDSNPSPDLLFE